MHCVDIQYYFSDNTILTYADYPDTLNEDLILPEISVSFKPHISFPSYEDLQENKIVCDWNMYDNILESLDWKNDELGKRTKILGYPDVIQGSMELYCEIMGRGYNYEDYLILTSEQKKEIQDSAKDWILLFQMGTISKDDFSLMFGDCGHIYFWIKKSDLEKKNFDEVWLILQCG